jgi:Fe-S cluster assembly protein SufB
MATPEMLVEQESLLGINADYKEKFGFHDPETGYAYKAPKGLTRELVEQISEFKNEPQWMREFRLKALEHFLSKPQPTWGSPMLAEVDYDNIHYFVRASEKSSRTWDDVPDDIKNTFDRLGIPEAERKFLSGVGAQYESEVVYHQVREDLEKQGVIFMDMDSGLREHEDLVREHFAKIIPSNDNKLAALNSAVWSGGSFVYVPPGVHVEMPLQAYFRINTENMGQFERTLIVADEGSYVHYVEGCTAPVWSSDSLHSAVVELLAKPGARIRYTTVQNWSQNVYNLVTKRAVAERDATVEWVDCNLGSKLTMKYPAVYLTGEGAHGEVLSIAFAGAGQHQDAGPRSSTRRPTRRRTSSPSRSPRTAGAPPTAACSRSPRAPRARSPRWSATPCCSTRVALGHLPDDPHRRGRRRRRPRGVGLEDRRGAALLPHGARHPEEEAGKLIVNGFIEPIVKELRWSTRSR